MEVLRLVWDDPNHRSDHGILGQKWGVKNGPPYPLNDGFSNEQVKLMESGKDFSIPTNVTMYRGTSNPNEKIDDRRKYVTIKQNDRSKYWGEWYDNFGFSHEIEYQPKEEIKVCGRVNSAQLILMIGQRNDLARQIKDEKDLEKLYKDASLDKPKTEAGKLYKSIGALMMKGPDDLTSMIYGELKALGYDAIIDPEDIIQGVDAPVIVFNTSKMKQTRVRSSDDAWNDIVNHYGGTAPSDEIEYYANQAIYDALFAMMYGR